VTIEPWMRPMHVKGQTMVHCITPETPLGLEVILVRIDRNLKSESTSLLTAT